MIYSVSKPQRNGYIRPVKIYPEKGFDANDPGGFHMIMIAQSMILALSKVFDNIPSVDVSGEIDDDTMYAVSVIQSIVGENNSQNSDTLFLWNNLSAMYEAYVSFDRVSNFN